MKIHELIQILVGPSGRFLRGLWEPDEILANLLWSADVTVSRTIAVQIINGKRSLPARYIKPYLAYGGLSMLEIDLNAFVAHYHSHAMLIDTCTRIHLAVAASNWSPETIATLDSYYVADAPSREQIAIYIAHVMYAIICS